MTDLRIAAKRNARRSAPAALVAPAAALPLGAFSGYAKRLLDRAAPRDKFRLTRGSLRVVPPLLPGIEARLSPRRPRGRRVRLVLRASQSAATGPYRLRTRARAGRLHRTLPLAVIVDTPGAGESGTWPPVAILDLPVDQDGCQGASVSLTYSADARLA